MKKIEIIFHFIEGQGISVSEFERKAGLGYSYLSKTRERGVDISQKVLDKFQQNAPDLYYEVFKGAKGKGIPSEPETNSQSPVRAVKDLFSQTLFNLSESNKALAEANRQLSEAHRLIAKNNDELLQMAKRSTGYASLQSQLDAAEKAADFLEIIAEIGSGHQLWRDKRQGLEALNRFVPDVPAPGEQSGNPVDSSRKDRIAQ